MTEQPAGGGTVPAAGPPRRGARWWQAQGVLVGLCLLAVALTVLLLGWRSDLPAATLLAVAGVLLAAEDLASHRLPNAVLAPTAVGTALLLLLAALLSGAWDGLGRAALAALLCGAGYLLLAVLRPTGLGMGDVKLGALLGLWLGWLGWGAVALGVLTGFVLGGVAGLVLMVSGRAGRTTAIAFGPWLLLGAALSTVLTVRAGPLLGL